MAEAAAISVHPLRRVPGVAIALTLLVVIFAAAAPAFISPANIANVLVQSTLLLLLSLPMTLVIMTEGLDLSMGAVLTLASVVVAMVSLATGSMPLGLLAAAAVGITFGFANGYLVAVLNIPPFVATLGTLGMAQGLALIASDSQSVVGIPRSVSDIYLAAPLGVPLPIIIGAVAYLVFHALLYHTRFGTYIFALGGNREALTYAGLSPTRLLVAVYAISGAMAGFAGLLMTARMNAGHPTAGLGLEFDAIAAVAVGGTSFERGNGWLLGTALGVFAVGVLRNGLNLLALPSSIQVASVGALVIVALFFDGLRSRS
jgi:ribose transport system permease protein